MGWLPRWLLVDVVIRLGIAVVVGVVLGWLLGFQMVAFAAIVLLVLRPATAVVPLRRSVSDHLERRAIAFYGVRGVGSFYYVAYATSDEVFSDARTLWSVVALVVVGSLLVHGTSAGPVMTVLDRRRRLRTSRRRGRFRRTPNAATTD